jgi:drug/metabolite transporter (DMT)-like permease
MLLPFLILIIEGIIPVIIKLHLTIIPYTLILVLSQILGLFFICSYAFLFKSHEIIEGFSNLNLKLLTIIILIAFFGTFIGKILFLKTINDNENISIFIIIMSLYPMITIIASYYLLKEKISYRQLLGYLLIIIGISFLLYKTA